MEPHGREKVENVRLQARTYWHSLNCGIALIELIRHDVPDFKAAHIRIDNVAGSTADRLARAVYQGKHTADGVITMEMFEAILRQ